MTAPENPGHARRSGPGTMEPLAEAAGPHAVAPAAPASLRPRPTGGGAIDRYPVGDAGTSASAAAPQPVVAIEVDPEAPGGPGFAAGCYRALEVLLALVALIVTMPILLVTALLVRLESPGAALIFHPRAGRSRIMRGEDLAERTDIVSSSGRFEPGKRYHVPTTFKLVKFRSMYSDSRERFPELFRYQYRSQAEFLNAHYKQEADPRVTRIGNLLRRTSLDEFPNFWNVLAGDLSLVGPRPEIVSCLPFYTAEQMRKFTVRPGITGLAQTNGRSLLTIGQVIDWDLIYVRRRSIALDLKILLVTAWKLIANRGAF